MDQLTVVHLQPIEQYPPVMNLLRHLASKGTAVVVHTTSGPKQGTAFTADGVQVLRHDKRWAPQRLRFMVANLFATLSLLKSAPTRLLYYDPFSAFPATVISLVRRRKTRIFNHCHEYYSPDWYRRSTTTLRFLHRLECLFLYSKVEFISQTNASRVALFIRDNPQVAKDKMKVSPNYPPRSWDLRGPERSSETVAPIRFVYIGVVSSEYTYIREFCQWIAENEGVATLDIYTRNCAQDVLDFLEDVGADNIKCNDRGIDYYRIPEILGNYDVGLLLYKAVTANFKYNESNKLFEYLSADLDVIFPREMLGVHPHETTNTYPIVRGLDFKLLASYDWMQLLEKDGLTFASKRKFADEVYDSLTSEIFAGAAA